jgi:hypothetical protein
MAACRRIRLICAADMFVIVDRHQFCKCPLSPRYSDRSSSHLVVKYVMNFECYVFLKGNNGLMFGWEPPSADLFKGDEEMDLFRIDNSLFNAMNLLKL